MPQVKYPKGFTDRIGRNIQFHRKRLGLKQSELAERLTDYYDGEFVISNDQISGYERGAYSPPAHILEALADVFDISIDALFERKKSEE